ncbi:MAG: hypothetical protein DRQ55_13490 [Planctomycetota bacterium]|nr:MAG: hypothetical protein DRQ55_13490 [Planctomycetota bacterium]
MSKPSLVCCLLLGALIAPACSTPNGETPAEMRAYSLSIRAEALEMIYDEQPELEAEIEAAAGYAIFSNLCIHPGLMTFANGYGILENNATGELQHMRMFRFGIGPGIAVKGFYTLLIIDDPEVLAEAWEGAGASGGYLDASFVFGDFGGDATASGTFGEGARGYIFTHTGVALEATLAFGSVSIDEGIQDEVEVVEEAGGTTE